MVFVNERWNKGLVVLSEEKDFREAVCTLLDVIMEVFERYANIFVNTNHL